MKNVRWLLALCVLFVVDCVQAQEGNRNIYIWDLTRSMVGRGTVNQQKTPNVYKDVEAYLIKDIENICAPNTEIVVIPFQERVLDSQYILSVPDASNESKEDIIARIKQVGPYCINNIPHSKTNISQPVEYAKSHFQKPDRVNKLVLLTDGYQNTTDDGMKVLGATLEQWSIEASVGDVLIYVMTTENALQPTCETGNVTFVQPGEFRGELEVVCLEPSRNINYNIKDGGKLVLSCDSRSATGIPSGVKIRVRSNQGAPIRIDEVVELNNAQLQITPQYNYEMLKATLPETISCTLTLNLENNELIVKEQNKKVVLQRSEVKLTLINKREKVLTINVVEE